MVVMHYHRWSLRPPLCRITHVYDAASAEDQGGHVLFGQWLDGSCFLRFGFLVLQLKDALCLCCRGVGGRAGGQTHVLVTSDHLFGWWWRAHLALVGARHGSR